MSTFLSDLRYAIRSLRKSPGFTGVAVLTLALGIGANTAIFSVADALIARPLRGVEANRLAVVAVGQKAPAAAADYLDWARLSRSFEQLAAYRQRDANLTGDGVVERVYAAGVTGNFFATLRADTVFGRTFSIGDDEVDAPIAVLSYGLWQRRFGGDPHIVGRVLDVDGRPRTIVGVMGQDFEVPVPTDMWLPLSLTAAERSRRDTLTLHVLGRLKPSTTIAEAQAEMLTTSRQLEAAYPTTNANRRAHVMALAEFAQGTITRAAIFLLLLLVAVVLLIACANIAGLQLARATGREREIALRTALGANRWRIVQLVLVENIVVAGMGGALSVMIASLCVGLLLRSMPGDVARLIPGFSQISIDSRALGFTILVTLASAILAALAPAFRSSRAYPSESLKEGRGSGIAFSRQHLRSVFVVGQLAVAFVMLVIGGLFVDGLRGLLRFQDVHDPQHVLVLSVNLPQTRYPDAETRERFYRVAVDRLAALPGVQRAATFSTIPLSNNGVTWSVVEVEGQPVARSMPRSGVVLQSVSSDYFRLMHIPLREGRLLEASDRPASLPVALVSEAMATRYWPHGSALGKRIRVGATDMAPWVVIVGVVGDVLYDWTNRVPEPGAYLPVSQAPRTTAQFAIRVNGNPTTLAQPARAQLAALDPLLPAFDVMPLSEAIRESLAGSSQIVTMMGMLGVLALLIAVVGLYGVIGYIVAARTREFGVRMALGARRADIFRLVMQHGIRLATLGLGLGMLFAIPAARLVRGLVFGAGAGAQVIWFEVALLLMAITLFASYVPAQRATKADPMSALRAE